MTVADPKVIPATEARALVEPLFAAHLPAKDHEIAMEQELLFGDEHDRSGVLVLPDGTEIEGDLELDHDDATFNGQRFRGVVALGRLTVTGDILNDNCDGGPFLVVLGALEARHILKGGSVMAVGGPVSASGLIYCDFNHGVFRAWGGVTAKQGLIIDDQRTEIEGPIDAVKLVLGQDDARDYLVPELLYAEEEGDESCDSGPVDDLNDLIKDRLVEGEPIFRPDAPRTRRS